MCKSYIFQFCLGIKDSDVEVWYYLHFCYVCCIPWIINIPLLYMFYVSVYSNICNEQRLYFMYKWVSFICDMFMYCLA